jgi:hypothetical protein
MDEPEGINRIEKWKRKKTGTVNENSIISNIRISCMLYVFY